MSPPTKTNKKKRKKEKKKKEKRKKKKKKTRPRRSTLGPLDGYSPPIVKVQKSAVPKIGKLSGDRHTKQPALR